MNLKHRNSQKRIHEPGRIYYTVTKTFQNYPYFKEPILCDLLVEELRLCKKLHRDQFGLLAFSIIYDHLNLMVQPSEEFNVSQIMKSLKENFSRDANYIMEFDDKKFIQKTKGDKGKEREVIRQKIIDWRERFITKYIRVHGDNPRIIEGDTSTCRLQLFGGCPYPRFKWQKSFHDHIIRNEKDYWAHYRYTIYNPQKHKLPGDWKYTSLNYIGDKELMDVVWW